MVPSSACDGERYGYEADPSVVTARAPLPSGVATHRFASLTDTIESAIAGGARAGGRGHARPAARRRDFRVRVFLGENDIRRVDPSPGRPQAVIGSANDPL